MATFQVLKFISHRDTQSDRPTNRYMDDYPPRMPTVQLAPRCNEICGRKPRVCFTSKNTSCKHITSSLLNINLSLHPTPFSHQSRVKQLPAEVHCQLYPIRLNSSIIILDGSHVRENVLRHLQTRQLDQLTQALITLVMGKEKQLLMQN